MDGSKLFLTRLRCQTQRMSTKALPNGRPLYVVLEDDALISDFSIKSGRLLGRGAKKKHEVRLTVDITVKVLRVFGQNQCLLSG